MRTDTRDNCRCTRLFNRLLDRIGIPDIPLEYLKPLVLLILQAAGVSDKSRHVHSSFDGLLHDFQSSVSSCSKHKQTQRRRAFRRHRHSKNEKKKRCWMKKRSHCRRGSGLHAARNTCRHWPLRWHLRSIQLFMRFTFNNNMASGGGNKGGLGASSKELFDRGWGRFIAEMLCGISDGVEEYWGWGRSIKCL